MNKILIVAVIIVINSGLMVNLSGQDADKLPRSNPEAEGVSSAGIIDFLNAIDTGRVEVHSYMFIRHGKVIAEGWWSPYGPDYKHTMASVRKTFVATAIGLAISENKLKITDKVISFFPYSLPDTISDYMKELTVQNLLSMSVGQDPIARGGGFNEDAIRIFLETAPVHKPGTVFLYNSQGTLLLAAIVQQVTGETVFDYLLPRIFKPLGIRGIDWDLTPQGINPSGLRLRTEDMGKFGQLLLQRGKWNNKQLIPEEWVKEATSFKIESQDPGNKHPKEQNDWMQGYCYQMWRTRDNGVRLDGGGGQFSIIYPDKDAVIVLTANARSTQDELDLVHNYLIPAIKSDKPLPENVGLYNQIVQRDAALSIKPPFAVLSKSEVEAKISGREFLLADNEYKIQSVYFAFSNDGCSFAIKRDNQITTIKTGLENWKMANSPFTSLLAPTLNNPSKSIDANYTVPPPLVKVGARYSWTDPNTLEISARYIEEGNGLQTIVCTFSEVNGAVSVSITPKAAAGPMGASSAGSAVTQLRGTLVNIK
jgi:CubicO group peptidase (beta-lactamase class C family)